MNRIIWMGIGVAIGVIAFRKITEAQSNLGPEGLNRAVGRLADGLYDFADAVRDGMNERETELRERPRHRRRPGEGRQQELRRQGCSPALAGREWEKRRHPHKGRRHGQRPGPHRSADHTRERTQ